VTCTSCVMQADLHYERMWGRMGRIIKAIVVLAAMVFVGLSGFAYLGDFAPATSDVSKPVTLNVD
jgi:hypothetical protein